MAYNNSTQLKNLTFDNLGEYESDYLALDLQEINGYLESVEFPENRIKNITGVMVLSGDNDHIALWLTESDNPLNENSIYYPLPHYINDEIIKEKCLPDYWKETNNYYSK